jgi:hypothetical protein
MQTQCIEMALMSQQEQQAFEQELLNAIRLAIVRLLSRSKNTIAFCESF